MGPVILAENSAGPSILTGSPPETSSTSGPAPIGDPVLPSFTTKICRAWPEHSTGGASEDFRLSTILSRAWTTDRHFSAYAATPIKRRLNTDAVGRDELDGLCMVLFVGDTDDPTAHATKQPAGEEWRRTTREKVESLLEAHPGGYSYDTQGGARPVYLLPEPFPLCTRDDAAAWRRYYFRVCCYFARRFGLILDPSCADWTRLYRAPKATREGKPGPEDYPAVGNPRRVGVLDYTPSEDDLEEDLATARRIMAEEQARHPGKLPLWKRVVDALSPPPPRPATPPRRKPNGSQADKRARGVIDLRAQKIREGRPGEDRLSLVYFAARRVAQFIAAGSLSPSCWHDAEAAFYAAAEANGIVSKEGERKVRKEISNGYEDGIATPEEMPDREGWSGRAANGDAAEAHAWEARQGPEAGTREPGEDDGPQGPWAPPADLQRGDEVELADVLLGELGAHDGPGVIGAAGALHRYNPDRGVWAPVPVEEQDRLLMKYAGFPTYSSTTTNGEIRHKPLKMGTHLIRGAQTLAISKTIEPSFFDDATPGLAFRNGFLRVTSSGALLTSHSAAHAARWGIECDFDESATTPEWERFLGEVLDPDSISTLQEFTGLCLAGMATRYQKAIALWGADGENGKTLFIEVIEGLFPAGAVTSVAPQALSSEYRRADLARALLNTCTELPERDILHSEVFKAAVTGDQMDGRPIRGAPIYFKPKAGNLYACNRLPRVADLDEAFWRRFIVLHFKKKFERGRVEKGIAGKILRAELPGLYAWAVTGLQRIIAQGHYTEPVESAEIKRRWRLESNPVALWLEDYYHPNRTLPETAADKDRMIPTKRLYESCSDWLRENGHKAISSTRLGTDLKSLGAHEARTGDTRGWVLPSLPHAPAPDDTF